MKRQSFCLVSKKIVYELGYVRTLSCIRRGQVRVVFESDSNSLGLLYNEGGTTPHVVTYDDLIAIEPQGSRYQGDQIIVISQGRSAHNHAPQM
jgi:hypothetical protein